MTTATMRRFALCTAFASLACKDGTGPGPDPSESDARRRLMVSESMACAIDSRGTVFCWGANSVFWEYGVSPNQQPGSPVPVATTIPKLAAFATGVGTHLCGITSAGSAVCWGRGGSGQLGGGVLGNTGNAPGIVSGDRTWLELSVGRLTTCGIDHDSKGYCWGLNQGGEAGSASLPVGARVLEPDEIDGGFFFTQIAAGWIHACGIVTEGDTYCWGKNTHGQLGLGSADTLNHGSPEKVAGGLSFVQLALGSRYSCGLTADSLAYCWGTNGTGQLGDGTTEQRDSPTPVAGGLKFKSIVASSGFAAGTNVPPPTPVQGGVGHTCALTAEGKAYCWGWNGNGQLGDGTIVTHTTPVAVSGDFSFATLGLGGSSTCGMRLGTVWCWGSNLFGQSGSDEESAVPKRVGSPFNKL